MKKIILLLFVAIIGACTSIDGFDETYFKVSANVECCSKLTKTIIDGAEYRWDGTESIGLFVSPFQENVCFTNLSGNTFYGIMERTGLKGNAQFYAYYPYVSTIEDGLVKSQISCSQRAPFDSSNDFMVSQCRALKYEEPNLTLPELSFSNHLCPIVNITVTNSNSAYRDYKLKKLILYSTATQLCGSISFDPSEGLACEATFSGTGKAITISYAQGAEPKLGIGNTTLNIVSIPSNVSDLKVKVVTDYGECTFSANYDICLVPGELFRLPPLDVSEKVFTGGGDDRIPCIFMGDSITQFWPGKSASFFSLNGFVPKGVSGQWTSHMLARFEKDVVNNNPKAVIINGGVNDISHPYPNGDINAILNNIKSMADMATAAGIKPIISTICPTGGGYKKLEPQIVQANVLIKEYAEKNDLPLVDYHSVLVGDDGYMPDEYASDGCHPTAAGYALMEAACLPIINEVIAE